MPAFLYAFAHVCLHACIILYACMRACLSLDMRMYKHVCFVCMYVCMYVCMHACMHACMYVCIYIYIYPCCMYAHACIRKHADVHAYAQAPPKKSCCFVCTSGPLPSYVKKNRAGPELLGSSHLGAEGLVVVSPQSSELLLALVEKPRSLKLRISDSTGACITWLRVWDVKFRIEKGSDVSPRSLCTLPHELGLAKARNRHENTRTGNIR